MADSDWSKLGPLRLTLARELERRNFYTTDGILQVGSVTLFGSLTVGSEITFCFLSIKLPVIRLVILIEFGDEELADFSDFQAVMR